MCLSTTFYIMDVRSIKFEIYMSSSKAANIFFLKDFIHLFIRDTQREAETQAEGEAGSLQEPDGGLDPRTPGSWPKPKADRCSTTEPPGRPQNDDFIAVLPNTALLIKSLSVRQKKTDVFKVSWQNGVMQACLGSPSTTREGNYIWLKICYQLGPRLWVASSLTEDYLVIISVLLGKIILKVRVLLSVGH